MNYESVLADLVRKATRSQEYHELGGLDGPDPLTLLEIALGAALTEVRVLKNHAHEWNEDDYCTVCGADGRA